MGVLENLKARATGAAQRVVFPEMGEDPRIDAAAAQLQADGLCVPVPLGVNDDLYAEAIATGRGLKPALALRMLKRPLYRAAAMVAVGEADVMVAGAVASTKKVIEAASIGIGLADGVSLPSSFFLMQFPDGRDVIFADCALNVAPDAQALAAIARASHASGSALLGDARVALLSFSTGASGSGDSVDVVRSAAEATGFIGPLQGDAALNAEIAARKGLGAGDANVLVFPSLDAGNIAYKLAQELAGAQAMGPILQGFAKPVCDLSRGATVDDIVAATVVTLALSGT